MEHKYDGQYDQVLLMPNTTDNTQTSYYIFHTLSIKSGLFVAATMRTSSNVSTPSISVRSCANTRSPTFDPSLLKQMNKIYFLRKKRNTINFKTVYLLCLTLDDELLRHQFHQKI